MILFSAIEAEDCLSAHKWHDEFAARDDALYPRDQDDFQSMVMAGSVWAAKSPAGDYLALAYASFNEETLECEIGGLMVAEEARGKGLGGTIMRLALAHMLLEENLLSIAGVRVVAHVVEGNQRPLGIIKNALRFRHVKPVQIPADVLPGLRSRDGFVFGDEFELDFPTSVLALAEWAENWNGHLNGGTAHIELRSGVKISDWAPALRSVAATPLP
jgi:GNAT superfamily N-acetyltransferase